METKTTTPLRAFAKSEAAEQGLEFYFDEDRAEHVKDFFESWLVHSKGKFAGKNFTLLPWQSVLLEDLFGWVRVEDDLRRYLFGVYQHCEEVGKEYPSCGHRSLSLSRGLGERRQRYTGAGADREQASLCFKEAASMVRASPLLSRYLEVVDSRRTIAYRATASFYRVLAADAFRAEGLNIHGLLFDELLPSETDVCSTHFVTVVRQGRNLFSVVSRRQAMIGTRSAMNSTATRRRS